jgi:hypothetical protein
MTTITVSKKAMMNEVNGLIAVLTEEKPHLDAIYQAEVDRMIASLDATKLRIRAGDPVIEVVREFQAKLEHVHALAVSMYNSASEHSMDKSV